MVNNVLPFDVFLARSKNWVRKKFYFFSDTGGAAKLQNPAFRQTTMKLGTKLRMEVKS